MAPHTRASDQRVEAFSLPRDLHARARERAKAHQMSRSGYYRYALALEMGYSEREARELALHMSVRKGIEPGAAYPAAAPSGLEMNEKATGPAGGLHDLAAAGTAGALGDTKRERGSRRRGPRKPRRAGKPDRE